VTVQVVETKSARVRSTEAVRKHLSNLAEDGATFGMTKMKT
jgi:hypothetical protein